jgi:Transposase DDE domain
MLDKNTVILNQLAQGRAELVGYSRFLNNQKVKTGSLVDSAVDRCARLVEGKHVLVLNDTTEFNFEDHINFLDRQDEDLGPTGNNEDIGFFLHPGLVLDAEQGMGLGFSYIKIWNRKYEKLDKAARHYTFQPIEEKESYRWIECGLESKRNLGSARHITLIADRESDIYDEFVKIPDVGTDLIIRSCHDRKLHDSDLALYETLSQTDLGGQYALKVRANPKGKRQARETEIEIRYRKVKIKRPNGTLKKDNTLPGYVELYAVEAREKQGHVPTGEKPICWRLLTTHSVNTVEEAQQIISWYAMRWQIELLFGTLKSKGLNMEASEVESGNGLKNLCLIGLQIALKINQLSQGRENESERSAEISFTKEQIVVLKALVNRYEGKTEKQKNKFKEGTIAWAAWVIARMGGWKGYASESKPGNKTMRIGLNQFEGIYIGWNLAQKICA